MKRFLHHPAHVVPWLTFMLLMLLISLARGDVWVSGMFAFFGAFELLAYARDLRLGRLEGPP